MGMKIKLFILSLLIIFLIPLVTQAFSFEYVNQSNYQYFYNEAGFFSGIWHGLIAPYALLVRWLSPLSDTFAVGMYAYENTGWFYDFGFLLGIAGSLPIGWLFAIIAFIALFI